MLLPGLLAAPTPCTQGCCRTWAALSLCLASRTRSLEMRSLAAKEMCAQSFSGNSYFPSWMLSNSMFWGAQWGGVRHGQARFLTSRREAQTQRGSGSTERRLRKGPRTQR